jgi:hypothetical protein
MGWTHGWRTHGERPGIYELLGDTLAPRAHQRGEIMWNAAIEELAGARGRRYVLDRGGVILSYGEVLGLWRADAGFRAYFTGLLANAPYTAFRWETPGITAQTAGKAFEFVLLDSPGLARAADAGAFGEHYGKSKDGAVAAFANLGNDAVMVVPCPLGEAAAYGHYTHLGAFVRNAPKGQVDALWRAVGEQMQLRLGTAAVWLSTAGAGVAWLHVRLDNRPKYYGFEPYRR